MSRVHFHSKEAIPEAADAALADARLVRVRNVLSASFVVQLQEMSLTPSNENRHQRYAELVGNELPGLIEATHAVAKRLKPLAGEDIGLTSAPEVPYFIGRKETPVHTDRYALSQSCPLAFGPLVFSIGFSGLAHFEDYGALALDGPETGVFDKAYADGLARNQEALFDRIDEIVPNQVPQECGDLVLIPGFPNPVVHKLAYPSLGRKALVGGQAWYLRSVFELDEELEPMLLRFAVVKLTKN